MSGCVCVTRLTWGRCRATTYLFTHTLLEYHVVETFHVTCEFPGSQEEFDELVGCDVPQWDDGIAWSGSDVDSDEGDLSA
jgi:hypothetical protein